MVKITRRKYTPSKKSNIPKTLSNSQHCLFHINDSIMTFDTLSPHAHTAQIKDLFCCKPQNQFQQWEPINTVPSICYPTEMIHPLSNHFQEARKEYHEGGGWKRKEIKDGMEEHNIERNPVTQMRKKNNRSKIEELRELNVKLGSERNKKKHHCI